MIGQLNKRITLATPQKKPNGRGGWTVDRANADRVEIWAGYSLLTIGEQLKYKELDQVATVQFVIRNRPGIIQDTRIEYMGSQYEIVQFGPHKKRPGYTVIQGREI